MFHEGFRNLQEDVQQIVETSAGEIGRAPAMAQADLERKYANLQSQYPTLSLALVRAPIDAAMTLPGADASKSATPSVGGTASDMPLATEGAALFAATAD